MSVIHNEFGPPVFEPPMVKAEEVTPQPQVVPQVVIDRPVPLPPPALVIPQAITDPAHVHPPRVLQSQSIGTPSRWPFGWPMLSRGAGIAENEPRNYVSFIPDRQQVGYDPNLGPVRPWSSVPNDFGPTVGPPPNPKVSLPRTGSFASDGSQNVVIGAPGTAAPPVAPEIASVGSIVSTLAYWAGHII